MRKSWYEEESRRGKLSLEGGTKKQKIKVKMEDL